MCLVAYSAWVYPFEAAFLKGAPKGGLCVIDNIIDLFFGVDIVLTFFVAYFDSRTQLLVQDQKKIAIRYVSKDMLNVLSRFNIPSIDLSQNSQLIQWIKARKVSCKFNYSSHRVLFSLLTREKK